MNNPPFDREGCGVKTVVVIALAVTAAGAISYLPSPAELPQYLFALLVNFLLFLALGLLLLYGWRWIQRQRH